MLKILTGLSRFFASGFIKRLAPPREHRYATTMQQRATSHDTQIAAQPPSGVASLSLKELAGLLRIGLDGVGIDHGMSYTLRRVEQGVALFRDDDPFGPIYAIRSGTFKSVLLDANGRYQVLDFPMASDTHQKRKGPGQFRAGPKGSKQRRRKKRFEQVLLIRPLGMPRIDKYHEQWRFATKGGVR